MSEPLQNNKTRAIAILNRTVVDSIDLDVEKTIYLAIFVVALLTRIWGVGDRVVSHDESLHTQYSYLYYNGDGYRHTPLMHGPTLFHITALSYWLFGVSDTSARIPVAIIGSILVVLPFFLRGWIGKKGALVASTLLLISPYITYYSRYIRHDILIITAAFIVVIAFLKYLRTRQDSHIWWFAVGMALMFTTMETSFIYVAIFGSFLALALAAKVFTAPWFLHRWKHVKLPLGIVLVSLAIFFSGFLGQRINEQRAITESEATPVVTDEGFAADPEQDLTAEEEPAAPENDVVFRWLQISGLILLSGGLFLTAHRLRPYIDQIAEFDLVILFTTLTLPTAASFLIVLAGKNPLQYTINKCELVGQETMSAFDLFFNRAMNATCRSAFFDSPVLVSAGFLILTLLVSVLVGLWWNRRRWLIAAAIFHGIYLLLFSSLFSNPSGWTSGMVGSLGYWLEQQEVQRANQPTNFYFFVLPLYEFLPVIFALAAGLFWAAKSRLHNLYTFMIGTGLVAWLAFEVTDWISNRDKVATDEISHTAGYIAIVVIFSVAAIIFVTRLVRWIRLERYGEDGIDNIETVWQRMHDAVGELFGSVPFFIWWVIASFIIYSHAGEKMAWLSSHFILPLVLLSGWFINDILVTANWDEIRSRRFILLTGLTLLFLVSLGLFLKPILLGDLSLGAQDIDNLTNLGRLIGSLIVLAAIYYLLRRTGTNFGIGTRWRSWIFAIFTLLALLTIRFTYMASFINADYVTEFLVYAHGAPATKSQVLTQLEELSMRLYGDKSIEVAFDNDSSWPFTWYLRDYPNRLYFGENPGRNVADAPVVLVGSLNWGKVEPILGDDYEERTYTFLWWPMEQYRNITWQSLIGDPEAEEGTRRGLGNPDVRKALWDIFFYRDYEKYGQVFGGNYSIGQWPLRHDLKMFIRKDVLTTIWDHGVDVLAAEPPVDPYAEGELTISPSQVIGSMGSGEGELLSPRNMTITNDGLIYVTDSGNHRIQVFDENGNFVNSWGEFGSNPGQFNEPWGIASDEDHIFVADTWNHRIQKFTHQGDLVDTFGVSGSPEAGQAGGGLFFGPRDIVINNQGNLVVTDTGNHRLQFFDKDGNFIEAVGSQGALPGQFFEPVGLASTSDGSILVADTWNGRVQQISQNMIPIFEWEVDAWYGESIENKPYLATDSENRIFVTDPEGYRVLIFDQFGQYIGKFGRYSPETDGFGLPNGVAVGPNGSLYIADAGNNHILRFDEEFPLFPIPQSE